MKKLFGCLIFIGSILLIGTAGASDQNMIDGSQIWLQVSISFCMIGSGLIGMKVIDKIRAEKKNAPSRPMPEAFLDVNMKCQQLQLHRNCITKKKGCQYFETIKTATYKFPRY